MPNFPHPYRNLKQFFRDTKTNILSISNVEQGATAYATDTNEVGSYNGTSWVWIKYDALNASNITQGTLSTDRFSAYADLQAENKIGLVSGKLADANSARNSISTTVREDFESTSPSGWNWASGTEFGTPGTVVTSNGTILRLINTTSLNNIRSFFFRSFPSGTTFIYAMVWFFSISNGHFSGLRWDDGGSNFVEVYIKYDSTSSPYYKLCGNHNGTETELTAYRMPILPFPLIIGINRSGSSWSSWNAQVYVESLTKIVASFSFGLSWTPTRVGFVTFWKGVSWNESFIDWIGGNGTW